MANLAANNGQRFWTFTHVQRCSILAAIFFSHVARALEGLRPIFFGPCTLGRTWGTRPGSRASFFAPATASPTNSALVQPPTQFPAVRTPLVRAFLRFVPLLTGVTIDLRRITQGL
jgi:hypothetical protein